MLPLLTATPYLQPQYAANSSSKRGIDSPNESGDLTAPERCDNCFDLFFADNWIEDLDHELLLTSTLILSFSAPMKGPCLTLMHCMSSMTRTACVP